MKIAAFLYSYPPHRHAGADVFNAHLLEQVAAAGHQVTVHTTAQSTTYLRNGVNITGPTGHARDTQVVFTAPDAGPSGPAFAARRGVPLVGVVHNVRPITTSALYTKRRHWDLVVYNSHSTREHHHYPGMVLTPPVSVPLFAATGDAVTLINVSKEKGALLWWELAARFPERPFLGVMSWGKQVLTHPDGLYCPNVSFIPTVPHERMVDVWARTSVLLTPSDEESWGMAAVEALAHSIPVIAHPTPGLVESLGWAGVFADRNDPDTWEQRLTHTPTTDVRQRAIEVAEWNTAGVAQFLAALEHL